MGKFLAATALAGSLLVGSALPSSAAVIALGAFSGSDTRSLGNTVKGTFTDQYTFSLNVAADLVAASITNSFSKASQFISDFVVSLYSGAVGSGTLLASSGAAPVLFAGFEATGISKSNVGTGNYYLQVSGTTGSASYGGSLAVNAVPLPSSVALFGVAVLGLGVAGAARRKATRTSEAKA